MKTSSDMVASVINLSEEVENLQRYKSANRSYYPCYVITKEGNAAPALFTQHDIEQAMERASKNTEDYGQMDEEEVSWWDSIWN